MHSRINADPNSSAQGTTTIIISIIILQWQIYVVRLFYGSRKLCKNYSRVNMIIVRKSVSSKWQRKTFLLLLLLSASSTSSCVSCGIFIICTYMGISSMNGRDENNDVMNGARKKRILSRFIIILSVVQQQDRRSSACS